MASCSTNVDVIRSATRIHLVSTRARHYLLDIVIREGPAILELLAGKDQTLLVRRDAFFVLDFRLHIVDRIAGLDLESDGLTRQGFHEAGSRC